MSISETYDDRRCPYCGRWREDVTMRRRRTAYPSNVETSNWMLSCLECYDADLAFCQCLETAYPKEA